MQLRRVSISMRCGLCPAGRACLSERAGRSAVIYLYLYLCSSKNNPKNQFVRLDGAR